MVDMLEPLLLASPTKSSKQTLLYHCFTLFCTTGLWAFLWCPGVSHTLDVGTVRSLVKNIKLRCLMVEKPEVSHTERPRICSYICMWRIKGLRSSTNKTLLVDYAGLWPMQLKIMNF